MSEAGLCAMGAGFSTATFCVALGAGVRAGVAAAFDGFAKLARACTGVGVTAAFVTGVGATAVCALFSAAIDSSDTTGVVVAPIAGAGALAGAGEGGVRAVRIGAFW